MKLVCYGTLIPRHLPNSFFSAMGQLKSLEKIFENDPDLKDSYEETIRTDLTKRFVRKLATVEIEKTTKFPRCFLRPHPIVKSHKPEKKRKVCNAAAKYPEISMIDKLFPGPDLLNTLFGITFRFRESQITMTADIESMFLQVVVPQYECKFPRFFWRPNPTQTVDVNE